MSADCYPVSLLPHITRLYADYLAMGDDQSAFASRRWYGAAPTSGEWMGTAAEAADPGRLADVLKIQSTDFGAGSETLSNIERLRTGARAVVTGQQVGLFGGPLLTLLKAATAIARAKEATTATGVAHVPIFWLATEDHDLEEVDQVTLLSKQGVETLRSSLKSKGEAVGGLRLGAGVEAVLEQAGELLGFAPVWDRLREFYTAEATMGQSFARWMTWLFREHGLIVMDASGRDFHQMGSSSLRAAIKQAPALEEALMVRGAELQDAGYHAQVLTKPGSSLLFLLEEETRERQALHRSARGEWKAGSRSYTETELLQILEEEPERISPNALLRPVFQDTILPTAAYVGGPAEVAYFAQSAVLYKQILGRLTPILPRFSATIVEPSIAAVMAKAELTVKDIFEAGTVGELIHRLGARAMPIEGKRRLAAAGNAMDSELVALTSYLASLDESLGRSAAVSANKMRYQMNRLRRMAATFETQKEGSLGKHAAAMVQHLFPDGHPQERVVGGIWFLAQYGDDMGEFIDLIVHKASTMCTGHAILMI